MKKLFLLLALLSAGLASAQVVPPGSATNPFNAGISVPGCTINAVVYIDASGNLACGGAPAPNYDATNIRLQVGTGSTTQAGWIFGNLGSGVSDIWSTAVSASSTNYILQRSHAGGSVYLNAPSGSLLGLNIADVTKMAFSATAGAGAAITAGTATTDVQSLSTTQTWNAAGVAFTGHKYTVTDTASAAGSLHSQWLGGAAGATALVSITKSGAFVLNGAAFVGQPFVLTPGGANVATINYKGFSNTSTGAFMFSSTSDAGTGPPDVYINREAAATVQLGEDVNGAAVAQTFKAHDGITGTDIAGANLTLAAGRGTGAGTAGNLRIQTAVPVTTGTTAQILADRELFVGKPRSVADNTATTLFTITLGDDTDGGGIVDFCSMATSATTDRQKTCGQIAFSGVDITAGAGGETCSAAITGTNNTSVSVGTLTVTAAATTGTDLCNIQITSDSSLNVAHLIRYSVRLHPSASTVVITPQ